MNDYIATFHTHLAAIMAHRALSALNISGTCVRYSADDAHTGAMGEDCESVFMVHPGKKEEYELIYSQE